MADDRQRIMLVYAKVKPEYREQFMTVTEENAVHSRQEPGVVRFDVIQREDDPNRFILVEVYRDDNAPAAHKQTEHYLKWREAVAEMMAEPREGVAYRPISPGTIE